MAAEVVVRAKTMVLLLLMIHCLFMFTLFRDFVCSLFHDVVFCAFCSLAYILLARERERERERENDEISKNTLKIRVLVKTVMIGDVIVMKTATVI